MRLLYSFRFQQVGETFLGAAVGPNAHLFNGVLQLNEVGHFIVSRLAKLVPNPSMQDVPADSDSQDVQHCQECPDYSESRIIRLLTDALENEYAVDHSTAQSAVTSVLDYLKAEQVIG